MYLVEERHIFFDQVSQVKKSSEKHSFMYLLRNYAVIKYKLQDGLHPKTKIVGYFWIQTASWQQTLKINKLKTN